MKILLAPSETKREGGDKKFDLNSLSLSSKLKESRNKLLQEYIHIVTSNKIEKIKNLTGIKKEKELEKYKKEIIMFIYSLTFLGYLKQTIIYHFIKLNKAKH